MSAGKKTKLRQGRINLPEERTVVAGCGMAPEVEDILFSVALNAGDRDCAETIKSSPIAEAEQDFAENP